MLRRSVIAFFICSLTYSLSTAGPYEDFVAFSTNNFGAEIENLAYTSLDGGNVGGDTLSIISEGEYVSISPNAIMFGFETNIPATTTVQWGTTAAYGTTTTVTDRHYYMHIHYATGLAENTEYNFRFTATDERGNTIYSANKTTTTKSIGNWARIPADLTTGPPYHLTTANTNYVLTDVVTASATAFNIEASSITIDLNGYVVTYNTSTRDSIPVSSNFTIFRANGYFGFKTPVSVTSVTIRNGWIKQGGGMNSGGNNALGFNPIYLRSVGAALIEGLTVEYSSAQTGAYFHFGSSGGRAHHNVFLDTGTYIVNRHGEGVRAIFEGYENMETDHNLVKRSRHSGVGGGPIYHNEVYLDSYDVNAFALLTTTGAEVYGNKVFGTGYTANASWWSFQINVHDNYILMIATTPSDRSDELGTYSSVSGPRVTQYSGNVETYTDLRYENNVSIVKASSGSILSRASQLASDQFITNTTVSSGIFKMEGLDGSVGRLTSNPTHMHEAVVTHGLPGRREDTKPLYYSTVTIESNLCNVRFGDSYTQGSNHHFELCEFKKFGNDPDYHTFIFDGGTSTIDHVIQDATFTGGASKTDVYWRDSLNDSFYDIRWTVTVTAPQGSTVTIKDTDSNTVHDSVFEAISSTDIVLIEREIRPTNWETTPGAIDATTGTGFSSVWKSTHTFTATLNGDTDEQTLFVTDLNLQVDLNPTSNVSKYETGGSLEFNGNVEVR